MTLKSFRCASLTRNTRLGERDAHRSLRRLVGSNAQPNTLLAQGQITHDLAALIRLDPLNLHVGMRRWPNNERTGRDCERVRRSQQEVSSGFHTRVAGDRLHGTAVRTHQEARTVEQCGHQVTSRAPSLTFTSESLTSILLLPRSRVRPESSKVILFSLESLSLIAGPSSSNNNLCSLVTITVTASPAPAGGSSFRQDQPV